MITVVSQVSMVTHSKSGDCFLEMERGSDTHLLLKKLYVKHSSYYTIIATLLLSTLRLGIGLQAFL